MTSEHFEVQYKMEELFLYQNRPEASWGPEQALVPGKGSTHLSTVSLNSFWTPSFVRPAAASSGPTGDDTFTVN